MNWNSIEKESSHKELIEIQDGQALIKSGKSSALIENERSTMPSLAELQQAGQEFLARLLRR